MCSNTIIFAWGSPRLYYLFGEGGQALANSLSVPNWFWEGDAVYQETLVSDQGRGRLPYFFNGYRALWAGDKTLFLDEAAEWLVPGLCARLVSARLYAGSVRPAEIRR